MPWTVLSAFYKYVIRYCVARTSSIHTAVLITSWFITNFTCCLVLLPYKKKCWKRVRKSYLGKTQVSVCWDLQRQHKPTVQNCVKTKQVSRIFEFYNFLFARSIRDKRYFGVCCCLWQSLKVQEKCDKCLTLSCDVSLEFVTCGVELLRAILHVYAGSLIFMK